MPARVLLAATGRSLTAARLAVAFREFGCLVEIVCPGGHPVARTRGTTTIHSFNGFRRLDSFSKAIVAAKPDLIIPCDQPATDLLCKLYKQSLADNKVLIRGVIEFSMGDSAAQIVWRSRSELIALAGTLGIRTAATAVGRRATSTIASWQGNVLAEVTFEVLRTCEAGGAAAVVRLTDNREISEAAELLARRLNLSGMFSFDFVLQDATACPYLTGMNAGATPTSHLALGPGRDVVASLYAAMSGEPVTGRKRVTDRDVIALFPAAWKNDPMSSFLTSGYHDVPWSELEMVRACLLDRSGPAERRSSRWGKDRTEVGGEVRPELMAPRN